MIDPRLHFNPDLGSNPLGARLSIVTVVTPDMGASIHFYRDLLGYELLQTGVLGDGISTLAGIDPAGRDYALLRQRGDAGGPAIRLLESPAGAPANRPCESATILDDGLAGIDLLTPDDGAAYNALSAAGVEILSFPQFYRLKGPKIGPGPEARIDTLDMELKLFTAIGPAGELLFINRGLAQGGLLWPVWDEPGSLYSGGHCILTCRDRWPLFAFYSQIFGIAPGSDRFMQQDPLNIAIGAPTGTYFRYGHLAEGIGLEWREFRSVEPTSAPPCPSDIARTGLAMMTVSVRDLGRVRANVKQAGAPFLGEGALPAVGALNPEGFHIRGPLGELIEVVC
jgi:catechol 2,3-dioxygenase-like lactoylglutathione lyase family enzyme